MLYAYFVINTACPQAFQELGNTFRISEAVIGHLWQDPPAGLGLADLADFEHFVSNAADIANIVARVPNLPHGVRQAARLRRAWHAVTAASVEAIEVKKRGRKPWTWTSCSPTRTSTR